MKYSIGLLSLFLSYPAIASDVIIGAEVDSNDLLLSLSSDTGSIHQGGHIQFFIDSDNNSSTGYSNGNISGADFMIEDGTLFSSTANSSSWSWQQIENIGFYTNDMPDYLDTYVALSTLSISNNATIKVGAHALNSNWNTISSFHGSTMQEFVLGSGSPPPQNVEVIASIANNNLTVGLDSNNGTITPSAHIQYFIDSDNNTNTGYSNSEVSGADYLLEDTTLYHSTSNSGWSWEYLGNINQNTSNLPNHTDSTASLSSLLIAGDTIKIGVLALNSSWNTIDNYHNSSMVSFTFNSLGNSFSAAYNQAYIENNTNADSISDITQANNAYILVDAFSDTGGDPAITSIISSMKSNNNEVAGYISAGTAEDWRSDFNQLAPPIRTTVEWPQWPGEYFINKTTTGALSVMKARIDKMANWGLDWVEFDNMDWRDDSNQYNLNVTVQEAEDYINELCDYTHSKGMKCMAKNTVASFANFDGVTYESEYDKTLQDWENDEPNGLPSFLSAGKPAIIFHYGQNDSECDSRYNYYKKKYGSNIQYSCQVGNSNGYKHY